MMVPAAKSETDTYKSPSKKTTADASKIENLMSDSIKSKSKWQS